jgi:ATP-binding cassette subfamily B protein
LRAVRLLISVSPVLAATAIAFTLLDAVVPNLTLIAMGSATGDIPAAVHGGLGSPAGHRLEWTLAIAGGLYAVFMLRGPASDALNATVRARMATELQERLVTAVSAPIGIEHLEDPAVLDRLSSAQGDLLGYQPADAPMTWLGALGDRLSGVLACAVLATFRWWLGVLLLFGWLAMRRPLRRMVTVRVATFRQATEPLRRSWYLLGLVWRPQAAKEVRIFGLADWAIRGYKETWYGAMAGPWRELRRTNRRVMAVSSVVFVAFAVSAGTLGWAAYHHEISLRTLAIMLPMLPASMTAGSITVTDYTLEIMLAAIPDLDGLTRDLHAGEEGCGAGRPAKGLPREEIRFDGVSFRYPQATQDTLTGLDLTLPAGSSLALVGANGAGKTTLITLMARLRDPTGGRILVDGVPMTELAAAEWQRQVAVVYQDFARLPLTARENVTMDLLGEAPDPAELTRAAERAGAAGLVEELPGGWDTVLSPQYDGGKDLSGGQWQRVALARALYAVERGARVLVLDEPTAHLDVRAEAAFYDRFLQITEGVTSLIISHRFSTVRRAERIAVIDAGRITELGSHAELIALGGTYARMFEIQAARFTP